MHGKHRDRKRVVTSLVGVVAMLTAVVMSSPAVAAAPGKKARVLVIRTQKALDVGNMVVTKISAYMDQILAMDSTIEIVAPSTLVIPGVDADTTATKPTKPVKTKPAKPAKADPKDLLAQADAAAAAADGAMARRKHADAIKHWTKALELYAADAGRLEDFSKYVTALAGRSAAYFASGYDDNGEEELAKTLAVSPDYTPPSDAPEAMVAALQRVKARWLPTVAQIKVTADAPGAVVMVNGVARGPAPATIGGLIPGPHLVRVVANGRAAYGQVVTLADVTVDVAATLPVAMPKDDGPVGVQPRVDPVATPTVTQPKSDDVTGLEFHIRAGNTDSAFQAQARRIAQANKLDAIYFSYVRSNGKDYDLGMFVWSAADGRIAALVPARLASDLTGLQVDVLDLCEKASAATKKFPDELALTGRAPIFDAAFLVADNKPPEPVWDPEPKKPEPVKEPVKPVRDPNKPVVVAPSIEERPRDSLDTFVQVEPKKGVGSVSAPYIPPRVEDDPAVYETWWFWTIVVGVVGGSATAIAMTQGGGTTDPEGFRTTVSW